MEHINAKKQQLKKQNEYNSNLKKSVSDTACNSRGHVSGIHILCYVLRACAAGCLRVFFPGEHALLHVILLRKVSQCGVCRLNGTPHPIYDPEVPSR